MTRETGFNSPHVRRTLLYALVTFITKGYNKSKRSQASSLNGPTLLLKSNRHDRLDRNRPPAFVPSTASCRTCVSDVDDL